MYKVVMSLQLSGYTIDTASCGCKAGKGPKASCKHVGALCYAFADFCRFGKLPEFITSTQKLQQWNKPRPCRVDIVPVVDLSSRRKDIQNKMIPNRPVPEEYDPRPLCMRSPEPHLLEELRIGLLKKNSDAVLVQLLVPPIHVALHDHDYVANNEDAVNLTQNDFNASSSLDYIYKNYHLSHLKKKN